MKIFIPLALVLFIFSSCSDQELENVNFNNPSESIDLEVDVNDTGELVYKVFYNEKNILQESKLGLVRKDSDFSKNLKIIEVSEKEEVSDDYTLLHGKQSEISYKANQYTLTVENEDQQQMEIDFHLGENSLGFRYRFPKGETGSKIISEEKTTFNFSSGARGWLQPMSKAKTGWSETNPSYEEYYKMNIPLETQPEIGEGWVYPALVKEEDNWVLISETAPNRNFSATRLKSEGNALKVSFPQKEEVFPGGELLPNGELPLESPWRTLAFGNLEKVVNNTIVTDLAVPAKQSETDYIKPGMASWSWALLKDASVNYDTTQEFIDYAAEMNWSYCLIDVNWDENIGWDRMKELADYANEKSIKLLVWYNSSGDWNSTPYTPKGKLLTAESRENQFRKLKKIGIAGVKIDFFGGDGQSMISYYHDILEDAAKHKLLVNFHGATLPRGWHRTYPNLMTIEAVKGHEFMTFEQENADLAPAHAAMLPFSRNVYDPMDFTPMVLDTIPNINRLSTPTFELALPVLFTSGIQHIAETPAGMEKQPEFVKEYLRDIPVQWDESKLVEGYPGQDVIMARRKGNTWHIVGINGEDKAKDFQLSLDFIDNASSAYLIKDGKDDFVKEQIEIQEPFEISVQPYGGFVIKITK